MAPRPGEEKHHEYTDVQVDAQKNGLDIDEAVTARISDDMLVEKSREAFRWKSKAGWRLVQILIVMGANQAAYGIDWGVISSINSLDRWRQYYGFENSGHIIGIINALMSIGAFTGAPFLSLSDKIGRRSVNFIGCFLTVVAAIIQAFAPTIQVLMFARWLLGFATALCTSAQYIAEVAPSHLRGNIVGVFGAFFQVGSLGIIGILMGLQSWDNDWSWRAGFLIQATLPAFVCCTIYFMCPESPRYMVMKGQREKARDMIAKYFTASQDVNHPYVDLMMYQIDESIENSAIGFRATWDFRIFFTKKTYFRTIILLVYSVWQSWNGGGIIGMYIDPAMKDLGITETLDILGINLGLTSTYFVFTLFGAYIIEKFRRRTLIFAGLVSIICAQTAVTITGWQFDENPTRGLSIAAVLFVFCFQVCSASFIATMHNLYPVELMSLPLRAKGMAMYTMFQGAASAVHGYGISIGISKIGYKIWAVYICFNFAMLIISYLIFPETGKLSLEEIDKIFETPNAPPIKLSVKIADAKWASIKLEKEAIRARQGTVSQA
ncbi:general substrate transporter [Plectosphaerella plurivora]|uniref:General substrate transporter n=1 Tax=Plectosphaerella plurivora TaxID=936078 RepID=A0A9P9A8J3_9PEZI|nr:general substrate transporter [Plectosphaerella plurivora]